jgi:hypothetical protein
MPALETYTWTGPDEKPGAEANDPGVNFNDSIRLRFPMSVGVQTGRDHG